MTGALWTGFSYRFDWQKFKETCVPDRKSVDKKNCRSDFDFHAEFSRNVTFYVEMSHFITKMSLFCFSCDFVPPGGFQPVRPTPKDEYACLRLRVRPSCTPRLEIGHILIKKCHILFRIDGFGRLRARGGYPMLVLRFPHRISALYLASDAQSSFFR